MIGKIIKKMRIDNNLTQSELSNLLNVDQTTLSGWERGYREPTFETIEKIAKVCNYKINFINTITNEFINTDNIERKE